MGQYYFAGWRLSSSSVTLPAGGPGGRWSRGRSARRRPGAWAVGRPTLYGGPVMLRPVRATTLFITLIDRSAHFFLTSIGRAAHTLRNSPGGSTRRGQRAFPYEYYDDGHTCC